MLLGHLFGDDVVYSCLTSRKESGGHDKPSQVEVTATHAKATMEIYIHKLSLKNQFVLPVHKLKTYNSMKIQINAFLTSIND